MINEDQVTDDADILVVAATVPADIGGGSNTGCGKAADLVESKMFLHQSMIIGKWKRIK